MKKPRARVMVYKDELLALKNIVDRLPPDVVDDAYVIRHKVIFLRLANAAQDITSKLER